VKACDESEECEDYEARALKPICEHFFTMASVGIYVSDDSELMREIKHKAETLHDGKVSAYLRSLVEKDLAGTAQKPDATDENILVELCERLRPESAAMLGEWLASQGLNQPRLLGKLLDALADSLMRDINNRVSYGDAPLVLVKILREDAQAVQPAYAFRQIPGTGEALAMAFNPEYYKSLSIDASRQAAKPKK
jgi:hypothetical protein